MKILPKSRTENIVVQHFGAETFVYDLTTHKAYNLNQTSAVVFNACDGKTFFDDLKRQYQFTDDLIYLALDELKKNSLIEDNQSFVSPLTEMNRREVIRKVGVASLVALPVISSLVAPMANNAQSCLANGAIAGNATDATCSIASPADASTVCDAQLGFRCCSGNAAYSGVITDFPPPPCGVQCVCVA